MDQYFYQWFYQQSKPTIQYHFKSTELMLSHNNQPFYTKPSNNQRSLFSVICYSESIQTYSFIWIVWHWNAFQIFVYSHISSYSSIQSIQIIIQLMTFPESIDKMLSLIHDNSHISNNMIIIMGCFFPFFDE